MNIKRTIIAATTALILTTTYSDASDNIEVSGDFLERTGVTAQMHSLKDMVLESSSVHANRCGSRVLSTDIPSFSPESVIFDTVSSFNNVNTQALHTVKKWYHSALSLKIQAAEKQVIDYSALTSFLKTAHYSNQHRARLIGNIVDNMQIARYVASIGTEVEYAGILNSGCIEKTRGEKSSGEKFNREQMLADITRADKHLTATLLHGDIVAETTYLFRSLSDEDLAQYESYTSSTTGRQFYSDLVDAVQKSLQLSGDRLLINKQNNLVGAVDF